MILDELYKLISSNLRDTVVINPRTRSELALLAVMAPLMATNLRATVQPQAWALDASPFAGGTVRRELTTEAAKLFWRHCKRKGSCTRMEDRPWAALGELGATDADMDVCYFEDDQSIGVSPERPLAQRFDFMEISHQGQGRISHYLSAWSFVSAPVFSPSRRVQPRTTQGHRVDRVVTL